MHLSKWGGTSRSLWAALYTTVSLGVGGGLSLKHFLYGE